ncbi:uncharacterized protein LOC102715836 isoform X2 [Oryza brachyantha]|uniref:uncharacterized protein LOC102715836 isoform X2 n=1 Tax=Oryza brachyantha TaxID=4533 RepID=UPI001ADBC3F5|nr:uncharacterized protein LOC102715836 isoform X2 [Oryza brachyantha]
MATSSGKRSVMGYRRSSCLQAVVLCQLLLPSTHIAAAAGKPKAAAPPAVAGPVSKVEDATRFQIYYGQSFKVVKNNWNGKSYLLMQNTSKMATKTKYCTGRIKSFVIPLANYSVDTTASPVSFFECVLQSYASGNVQLINKTDAQILTQFSAHFMSTTDEGCNFAAYVPSEEATPLQRAEWIKYLGAFTNSEDRANTVYDAIKTNYLCLSKAAANLSTRFKPIVAWVEFTQGMWTFVSEGWIVQYVTDAGAEVVDATITNRRFNVSDPEDMDNFHAILCTVDVVIDQTYASEPAEYKLSTFLESINVDRDSCFSFVANRSIWRFDKRIGYSKKLDWFDGAISQPQLVLADLIEILFPTGNYTTIYFRNLMKDEGVTEVVPEMCSRSISTPMEPTILPCQ